MSAAQQWLQAHPLFVRFHLPAVFLLPALVRVWEVRR